MLSQNASELFSASVSVNVNVMPFFFLLQSSHLFMFVLSCN